MKIKHVTANKIIKLKETTVLYLAPERIVFVVSDEAVETIKTNCVVEIVFGLSFVLFSLNMTVIHFSLPPV